jgi:hypothetical protein
MKCKRCKCELDKFIVIDTTFGEHRSTDRCIEALAYKIDTLENRLNDLEAVKS